MAFDKPQSRNEAILQNMLGANNELEPPKSRVEALLQELSGKMPEANPSEGTTTGTLERLKIGDDIYTVEGGGSGTSDYDALNNKPQIAGTTLSGNKSLADLGIASASAVSDILNGTDIDSFGDVETALAGKADLTDLAPAFSTETAYAVGKYVSYGGNIYKCTSAHSAGAWAAGDFTIVAVGSELESKQDTLTFDDVPTANSNNPVKSGGVKSAIDAAVASAYHHAGTKTCAELVAGLLVAGNEGNVYNMTDSGTTTADFIEGAGQPIKAGDNVGVCKVSDGVYKFDLLSGFVDTSNFVQKSETAGLLKNDGTVNDEIEGDVSTLKSGFTTLDNEVNGDAVEYPYADVITIPDAIPANVADCTVKIEPDQDLHGFDKPWVGGAGKNKLPLVLADIKTANTTGTWSGNAYTVNDVTFTILTDNDGNIIGIKTSGTSSGYIYFNVATVSFESGVVINGAPAGGGEYKWFQAIDSTSDYDTGSGTTLSVSVTNKKFMIVVANGVDMSNKTFYPMIRLATETDATFAPYTNYCPITGHTEASVQRDGVNLAFKKISGYTINANGVIEALASYNIFVGRVKKGQTYTVTKSSDYEVYAFYTTEPSDGSTSYDGSRVALQEEADYYTIIAPIDGYIAFRTNVGFDNGKLELGSTATPYEPYQGKTYTIALGDTIYKGELDVDSGAMAVTHAVVDMGTLPWNKIADGLYRAEQSGMKNTADDEIADMLCETYFPDMYRRLPAGSIALRYTNQIWVRDSTVADATELATNLDGKELCYPLGTPTTIQLTPQQIQLLKGTNTITASTGQISVTVNGVSGSIGQVQEQVNELAEAGDVYSATGVKVGTWLDEDLYRKVVSLGALPNDDTKLVPLSMANDEKPLFFTAFATNSAGNVQPLPYVDDYAKSADVLCDIVPVVDGDGFNMRIITAYDKSSYNGYCILYYTKTT